LPPVHGESFRFTLTTFCHDAALVGSSLLQMLELEHRTKSVPFFANAGARACERERG